MFDTEKIYAEVEAMRLARGWSFYRLAELSGVSVNSLYSWRDRKSLPTLATLDALASAFEVDPLIFLVGAEGLEARSKEESELLERWKQLSNEQKNSLMHMLRAFTKITD